MNKRLKVGISACLMGQEVRYDGGHKRQDWLEQLESFCDFVPLCPESGAGLGIPRPPVHLVSIDGNVRAVGVNDGSLDVTDALMSYAEHIMPSLIDLDAFIVKARSPSCGLGTTPLNEALSDGLFVTQFKKNYPYKPIFDETNGDGLVSELMELSNQKYSGGSDV